MKGIKGNDYLFISFYTSPYLCLAITSCKASHCCISVSQYFFLLLRIALNSYLWPERRYYILYKNVHHNNSHEKFPTFNSFTLSSCYLAITLSCHLLSRIILPPPLPLIVRLSLWGQGVIVPLRLQLQTMHREVVYEDKSSKFLPFDTLVRVELNMVISVLQHLPHTPQTTRIRNSSSPLLHQHKSKSSTHQLKS